MQGRRRVCREGLLRGWSRNDAGRRRRRVRVICLRGRQLRQQEVRGGGEQGESAYGEEASGLRSSLRWRILGGRKEQILGRRARIPAGLS